MQNNNKHYRYTLEHCSGSNRKKPCPACGQMTFVRYIDTETGEYLADDVGRCDRECSCGYHKKPRDFFAEGGAKPQKSYWFPKPEYRQAQARSTFSVINPQMVEDSLERFAFNNFNIWLRERFRCPEVLTQLLRYKVGTHNLWPGATVFWQIDEQQRVRTGKIMLYNYHTGHRVKSPQSRVSWVHHQPQFTDFHLRQCLFGLHLLTPDTHTVCIVEAEKTAVIASIFFPDTLFLATGGITNLRPETCEPLKGRNIILFPDLGAEENWAEKARNIPALRGCHLSTWLSRHSTPEMRSAGLDLADVLENWNPSEKLRIEDFLEG